MREILFRGKRIDNGEWVEGYYVKALDMYDKEIHTIFDTATTFYSCGETSGFELVDQETIGQYTGFTDKNGKKIWENDIISYQRDNDDCPFPNKDTKKRLGKVFYQGFRSTFAIGMGRNGSRSINDDLWKYVQNGNRVEVIGNRFDNPELLEEQDGEINKNVQ
ncbi:YopX family protein [Hominiventricola filiformis]|uniref:YopX family protein n=1 Tax=Hominiventricola filiformis TaxID=2885352 RepID=A0AAE3A4J2_9FIRM|nr:YopX family protein [Hominiventricola filiformis]MCC2125289.1 YopX family protein [Hominiventricola filiformis]